MRTPLRKDMPDEQVLLLMAERAGLLSIPFLSPSLPPGLLLCLLLLYQLLAEGSFLSRLGALGHG